MALSPLRGWQTVTIDSQGSQTINILDSSPVVLGDEGLVDEVSVLFDESSLIAQPQILPTHRRNWHVAVLKSSALRSRLPQRWVPCRCKDPTLRIHRFLAEVEEAEVILSMKRVDIDTTRGFLASRKTMNVVARR